MERSAVTNIKKLREGQNIAIFPFSMDFGDSFNAIGFPCPGRGPDLPIELRDPFQAKFLSYSGTVLMVSTKKYPCLLIDFDFIREVEPVG